MKKTATNHLIVVLVSAVIVMLAISCGNQQKKADEAKKSASVEKYLGLQLWSVRADMSKDAAATLDSVGSMGYKFIEAAGYGDGEIYGMDPLDFKNLCEKNGVAFLGAHVGQDIPDEAKWDETMAWWDTCIEAHKLAGVKWIVQPFMGKTGYESVDGLKKYCDYFNAIGEKCNAAGIRFGYHNHDKEFSTVLDGKPVYDWMLEFTDPEKVMFEMDLYWVVVGGAKPTDYFEKYPGRFELWHIKDKTELGSADSIVHFKPIFAEKDKSGLKYGIIEVEEYNYAPLESCRKSLEFLNAEDFVKM
ncbi:MAG: sugar phosphate isomerase [Draconibacterium sp.]|nr:MAG: sugar phosphate isomerase [Draconibacterium sp.]